jgi:hypothetical protein
MKKKALKVIGIILLLIVGLLIAAPFILEAKIGDLIKSNVNNNVNAHLDFADANLSLVKSFPNANLRLEGVSLVNKAPFEGDTLFAAKELSLTLGVSELFKSEGEPLALKNLSVDGANIHVKVDEEELANYEIANDDGNEELESSEGFTLNLQSYDITNSKVIYDDRAAKVYLVVSDIQHFGTGDLSAVTSELDTKTEALVTFELDSTNYLNQNKIKLNALIGIDLKEDKYTFLKNEALVNKLPLVFDGFVKVNENSQDIDISFKTPSSDFKNFLAVIPEEYSKNISNVQTTGDFVIEGNFNGVVDEAHIPKFNIKINSNNASFKYPDLPKSVRNVFIDTKIINTTGITEDTYVDIDKLSFMIDEDKFNMVAKIKELMGNTKVNAQVDAKMNLANIKKAYPVPSDLDLKGLLNADITTSFDMASIEKKQYGNTNTTGKISLKGFEYNSDEMANPVKLSSTTLTFNPKTVTLNEMNGKTGQTDFNATGTIHNFLGYLFNDEKVEGNFNLQSNTFALNDFMVEEDVAATEENGSTSQTAASEEKIKIPSFLDANINASANTVLYDNLTLKDVKGNLRIKDEKAILSNMTSSLFNGKVNFDGEVSTKNATPTFAMKLGMDQLQIGETFKALELFEVLAPIAGALRGKLNSDVVLSGSLTDDFTPDLTNLSGNVLAELLATDIDSEKANLLKALSSKLDFIKLDKLDLKGLKTALNFEDGVVTVKPFTIKYDDIAISVDGSHSFDRKLNYKATMEVPAKYLGTEVNNLIAKIDEKELENLTIPVIANIGGNYSSPAVTTDLTGGVKSLTSKLVEIQKQKLINAGTDKAKDLLGNVLGGNETEKDSTTQDPAKEGAKEILGGILGSNKEKDSTVATTDSIPVEKKEEDVVKEKAKDILGGFFGKKKKKDTVEKDSIN